MRSLVSVVMASFQRRHLLKRSLICYEKQHFDNDRFELVVVDDHSTDGTREEVIEWSKRTNIKATVITSSPKPGEWVDCGWILNAGIRASQGEHIILTHPEVMPGRKSVAECVRQLQNFETTRKLYPNLMGAYACCKPYYLTQQDQERIDTVDWEGKGPLAVRDIQGFYDREQHMMGNPDYAPWSIESVGKEGSPHSHWLSWVFGGCSRETWKRMGGFLVTSTWGACDVAFVHRRRTLGIVNHTCIDDDTLCCHQNHDDPKVNTVTPRIEDLWKAELSKVPLHDPKSVQYPAVDELGWS